MLPFTKDMCRPFTPEDFTKPLQPEIEKGIEQEMDRILDEQVKNSPWKFMHKIWDKRSLRPTLISILRHRGRVKMASR